MRLGETGETRGGKFNLRPGGSLKYTRTHHLYRLHGVCTDPDCDWEIYGVRDLRKKSHDRHPSEVRRNCRRHACKTGHTVTLKRIETILPPPTEQQP